MRAKLLSMLASGAAILTVLGGLDQSGIVNLLPAEVATAFTVALPALAAVVHAVKAIGDAVDDGKINDSFRFCHPFAVICAAVIALACSSCSADSTWYVRTPYGDANGGGREIIIAPRPIIIPAK